MVALILVLIAFIVMWFASNLVVLNTARLARTFHASMFSSAFLILGIFTSLPEFSIGLSATLENRPELFVGNLIGATFALIALLIPAFAVVGNGIRLNHNLDSGRLAFALFVILLPALSALDGALTKIEGFVMVLAYVILMLIAKQHPTLKDRLIFIAAYRQKLGMKQLGAVIVGALLLLGASRMLVDNTLVLSSTLGLSTFVVSLLVFSLGTNLPEILVGLRSVLKKKKDIAFGNYLGSAATNSLFFGLFTLMSQKQHVDGAALQWAAVFLVLAVLGFFLFARTKRTLSRKEGIFLLVIYILFVITELENIGVQR